MTLDTEFPAASVDLERVRIGPCQIGGHSVILRPPVFADFDTWRRLRLRDRQYIEPYWISSALDWPRRHTHKAWVRECMLRRSRAHSRVGLGMVIEVDGRFAGQISLSAIDFVAKSAELGIWADVTLGRTGVAGAAAGLIQEYGFEVLGLERIVAPTCTENVPACRSVERAGWVREAVMVEYFDAGGSFKDHALYSMLTTDLPPEGLLNRWITEFEASHALRHTQTNETPPAPAPSRVRTALSHLRTSGSVARYWASRARARYRGLRAVERQGAVLRGPSGPVTLRKTSSRSSSLREVFVIEVDGARQGQCGLEQIDNFQRGARIFFDFGSLPPNPEFAEAAGRLLLEYGFGARNLNRIWAAIASDDALRSGVAARLGMACEGTMRGYLPGPPRSDRDLWAITAAAAQRRVNAPAE